jgi:uncharacterized membrane protein
MTKRFLVLAGLINVATCAAALLAFSRLPVRIPTHWNLDGVADAFGSRLAIFTFTAIMLVFSALWTVLPRVSPQRYGVEGFGPVWWRSGLLVVALLGYAQMMLLWQLLGGPVPMDRALGGGLAILAILLGNVLGKVRRNFWLGIRTPWTLASERVWYATHRLAGKTMVLGGLLALAGLAAGAPARFATLAVVAAALLPAAWSLIYYRRLQRAGGAGL